MIGKQDDFVVHMSVLALFLTVVTLDKSLALSKASFTSAVERKLARLKLSHP